MFSSSYHQLSSERLGFLYHSIQLSAYSAAVLLVHWNYYLQSSLHQSVSLVCWVLCWVYSLWYEWMPSLCWLKWQHWFHRKESGTDELIIEWYDFYIVQVLPHSSQLFYHSCHTCFRLAYDLLDQMHTLNINEKKKDYFSISTIQVFTFSKDSLSVIS